MRRFKIYVSFVLALAVLQASRDEAETDKIIFTVPEKIKAGSVSEIHFSFTNPFAEPLTNCELTVEGPGLQRPKTVRLSNVPSNGQVKHSESLMPRKPGSRVLVATFNSDQLGSIKGHRKISIES